MITVDLSSLKANDIEYEELSKTISNRFDCEWDDSVHESYRIYVRNVQERSRSIHMIRCKAEVLAKEIEELKIDEVIHKAEILCEESSSV